MNKLYVPEKITISFGDSEPVTYTLEEATAINFEPLDLKGIDTVTLGDVGTYTTERMSDVGCSMIMMDDEEEDEGVNFIF